MFPILLKLGPFTLHTYGALVALGVYLGHRRILTLARRQNLEEKTVIDLTWIALLAGLAGARILYVAFHWDEYRAAPLDILKLWQGGLVWYGGLLAGILAGVVWAKRKKAPILRIADIFAPSVALAHGIGRLGCFFAGCCYGRACSLPWAVTYRSTNALAPLGVPLHPSPLYEAALGFLLFLGLNHLLRSDKLSKVIGPGIIALLYVMAYSVIRFIVEFTRNDDRGPIFFHLTFTQWIAVAGWILAETGLVVLLVQRKKNALR